MKIVGLITEYNPLHNGHLYHIEQARALTGADFVVLVMSGDFVQRGAPALYDKHTRTQMALKAGADLVLELPVPFSTSSAEDFSACAVSLLDQLGVVDSICFGSECGDIRILSDIANILVREPEEYTVSLKEFLKEGITFPQARSRALLSCLTDSTCEEVLNSPNNILGIEYIKSLIKRNSSITPVTIARQGGGYHESGITPGASCSASAIRRVLLNRESLEPVASQVPDFVFRTLREGLPIWPDDLSNLLNYKLLYLISQEAVLSDYADLSPELEARLRRSYLEFDSFEQRIARLKTRQYTYTRISRALLHLILDIKDSDIAAYRSEDYVSYARVLGFRSSSHQVMKQIKSHSSIPLITKIACAQKQLSYTGNRMLNQTIYSSHIYQSMIQNRYGILPRNEYTSPVVILPS